MLFSGSWQKQNWIVTKEKKKFNCHASKMNKILQYVKTIYSKLLAATEATIFHIWPLSCPFITVLKKSFDGNKRPGSACNDCGGGVAELRSQFVCVLLSDRAILWWLLHILAAPLPQPSSWPLLTRKPNNMPLIKTINLLDHIEILHTNRKRIMAQGKGEKRCC